MVWAKSRAVRTGRAVAHAGAFGIAVVVGSGLAGAETLGLRELSGTEEAAPITCVEGSGECHTLLGVTIDGASAIPVSDLATSYESYLTRQVSLPDLVRIADAITRRYREAGFFLSQAIVPSQDFSSGLARIVVVEGRITNVVIEGEARAIVAPHLEGLTAAPIAQLDDLERRLTLAGDAPGVSLRTSIRPNLENRGAHELVVESTLARDSGYLIADNRGARDNRRLQLYGRADRSSAIHPGDRASISFVTTPEAAGDFYFVEGAYSYTYTDGGRVAASVSTSSAHDGADGSSNQTRNEALTAAVFYERPLLRQRELGVWLGGGFEVSEAQGDWSSGGRYIDNLRTARLQLRGFLNDDGQASSLLLRTSIGLNAFGASGRSALRSRADADASFFSAYLHASHYRDVGRWFGFYAAADAQWSDSPLLMSEEFYVGGAPYGRGYDFGELSGDRGAAALVELRAGLDPDFGDISFIQAYAFADVAEVWNFDGGADSLSSAGGGLRVTFDDWLIAQLEFARPLTRTPYQDEDKDWRQYFSLAATY